MLLRLEGIHGPFEGLCGVYELTEDDATASAASSSPRFRFLGCFDGFSDWLLYFSKQHQNWVVGRAVDRDSGAGWVCSERLAPENNTSAYGDPALCGEWKVFDSDRGRWSVQPNVRLTRPKYIPSHLLSNSEAEAVLLREQLDQARKELMESETKLIQLDAELIQVREARDALDAQLAMQYKRQQNLKAALAQGNQLALEKAAFGVLAAARVGLDSPQNHGRRFTASLLLNFIEGVVEKFVSDSRSDSGVTIAGKEPVSLAELEMRTRRDTTSSTGSRKGFGGNNSQNATSKNHGKMQQRKRCTKCYKRFSRCTCEKCFECVGIINKMGRDRHHCRKCGVPLCNNHWCKNDPARGKKVCNGVMRCEQRQYQLNQFSQLVDASAVDEDELQQSMGVSDSDDTTGPDASSGRSAESLNNHVGKQPVGTIGEEGEEEQLGASAASSASTAAPALVHPEQAVLQGSGKTKKHKKRQQRRSAGVPAMAGGGRENYDSMRTELDLAQRLSRLDPDDDTTPYEMAQKLVQSCNDLQAISGADSDTDTTESL